MEDLRNEDGDWNEAPRALARELEAELIRLSKKYATKLPYDTIKYVMYSEVQYVKNFTSENGKLNHE